VQRILISILTITTLASACLIERSAPTDITLYGFSIMKEAMEKAIIPGFTQSWKEKSGQEVSVTSSYAGSETITNQILSGVKADVAILSIERDAQRLKEKGFVSSDWRALPCKGIINKTPFVILVRKGNPKKIRDFADLARPGIRLIHPDPVSSGGAQWSLLAIYGSELIKSERETGEANKERAADLLKRIWANVVTTPGSAREGRTQFETGFGDALITYEMDALLMQDKQGGKGGEVEIAVPQASIFSEHPVVMIDRNISGDRRPLVEAFVNYLWSREAQGAFVKYYLRSVTDESLNKNEPRFAAIQLPFTIDYFGGWERAFPEIIEGVWKNRIRSSGGD